MVCQRRVVVTSRRCEGSVCTYVRGGGAGGAVVSLSMVVVGRAMLEVLCAYRRTWGLTVVGAAGGRHGGWGSICEMCAP